MAVIFHTSVHFIMRGYPYLTERSSVCDFDETFNVLSNNSHIIATYAEVLKYSVKSVKFNMLEKIITVFTSVYTRLYCFNLWFMNRL